MQDNTFTFERDETLSVLVDMGYPFKEALIAIEKCGACNALLLLFYHIVSYLSTLFYFKIPLSSFVFPLEAVLNDLNKLKS